MSDDFSQQPDPSTSQDTQGSVAQPTPAPDPASMPQTPQNTKGGLFRHLLAGAILGIAGGLSGPQQGPNATTPGQAFGQGLDKATGVQQQGFKNQMVSNQDQREDQKLDLEKQRTNAQVSLDNVQAATSMMNKMLIEKQIEFLPQEMQTKMAQGYAAVVKAYSDAGLNIVAEVQDDPKDKSAFLDTLHQQGKSASDYLFAPDPTTGKMFVMQRDPTKTISADKVTALGKAFDIPLPSVDMPTTTFDSVLSAALRDKTDKSIENMRASGALAVAKESGARAIQVANINNEGRENIAQTKSHDSELKALEAQNTTLMKAQADHTVAEALGLSPESISQSLQQNNARITELRGGSTASVTHKVGDTVTVRGQKIQITSVDPKTGKYKGTPVKF